MIGHYISVGPKQIRGRLLFVESCIDGFTKSALAVWIIDNTDDVQRIVVKPGETLVDLTHQAELKELGFKP